MTRVSIYLSKNHDGNRSTRRKPITLKKSLKNANNKMEKKKSIKKKQKKANHRMNMKWYDSIKGGDVD